MALYIILLIAGLNVPYLYPLLIITAGGYLLEITRMKKVSPDLVHITRNTETCINCGLCSTKCPQGIDVASMEKVTHTDCTLCGDCLYECPEKNTLQINRKNIKWLPAAALALLIAIGITLGSIFELPTIDQKWGDSGQLSKAQIFTQSGLKNIKCFGSSTAFANQMRKVNGIYGVATFVGSHTVKIYYDPDVFNEETLQKLIFVPEKRIIKPVSADTDSISFYTLTVDQFFDPLDAVYLQNLLSQKTEACGFQSEFACPVLIRVYFPAGRQPSPGTLSEIIETRKLAFESNNNEFYVKLKYKVVTIDDKAETISRPEYSKAMYLPLSSEFNGFDTFTPDVMKEYILQMGDNSILRNRYNYLVSHLSNDPGIVAFKTIIDTAGFEAGIVSFIDTITTAEDIYETINADTLLFHYTDGRIGKIVNPFSFPEKGIEKDK